MNLFSFIYFLLQIVFVTSSASSFDGENLEENIHKLSIKKLRTMLWQRGLECKGCAEKPDFIKMVTEHLNDPILKGREDSSSGKTTTNSDEDKSVDDILEQLKKSGMGGAKVFTAKDFEGLSPEEMSAKFGNDDVKPKGKRNAPKTSKNKMKMPQSNDNSENIEL